MVQEVRHLRDYIIVGDSLVLCAYCLLHECFKKDLELLDSTGVEDKMQDEVKNTLKLCGIRVLGRQSQRP